MPGAPASSQHRPKLYNRGAHSRERASSSRHHLFPNTLHGGSHPYPLRGTPVKSRRGGILEDDVQTKRLKRARWKLALPARAPRGFSQLEAGAPGSRARGFSQPEAGSPPYSPPPFYVTVRATVAELNTTSHDETEKGEDELCKPTKQNYAFLSTP